MSETTNHKAFICTPCHHKGEPLPRPSTPSIYPFPQQNNCSIPNFQSRPQNQANSKKMHEKTWGCPSDLIYAATTQSSLQDRCHPKRLPKCPKEFPHSGHARHWALTRPHTTSDWPNRRESDIHESQGPRAAPLKWCCKTSREFQPSCSKTNANTTLNQKASA